MKTKSIYLIFTLLGVFFFSVACNNEWEDELYSQMVSLKAPINTDVTNLYLKYETNGEVTYQLPVLISGSRANNRNFNVKIGVDNDTIPALNTSIYSDRSDLYYHQLGEQYYEFPSGVCNVPAGSDMALFPIKFKFADLNLVEKYVLPVTIEPDPSYTMNVYKGRNKALLWVRPFNDFSGNYSATGVNVYYGTSASGTALLSSYRMAQVVDEKTVFWYAGATEELSRDRGNYKINAEFQRADTVYLVDKETQLPNGLIEATGKLRLYCDNPSVNFEVVPTNLIPEPYYTVSETWDPDRPFVKRRVITLYIAHRYQDYTSSPNIQFQYYCAGSMTMQRNINTLVPEDMQANYW
jgi:hypothetical protein